MKKRNASDLWEVVYNFSCVARSAANGDRMHLLDGAFPRVEEAFAEITGWSPIWRNDKWVMEKSE